MEEIRALTGPMAAAMHDLHGFRQLNWRSRWCCPYSRRGGTDTIRTRRWSEPVSVDGIAVAPVPLVLRHLAGLESHPDNVTESDRVELAVEDALHRGLVDLSDLRAAGGNGAGDALLNMVVRRRGNEPATESYAETRALQLLRSAGWYSWRQVPVVRRGRPIHRADLVIPFGNPKRRPVFAEPSSGLIVEVDSKEFHANEFERDHLKQSHYDELGLHYISFTPTQVETNPSLVISAVKGALGRAARVAWRP